MHENLGEKVVSVNAKDRKRQRKFRGTRNYFPGSSGGGVRQICGTSKSGVAEFMLKTKKSFVIMYFVV
jgi:hypothetical protein